MGTREEADLAELRRVGRELQAQLPKPRGKLRDRNAADNALEAVDTGCMLSEMGMAGVIAGAFGAAVWLVRRRRRDVK